MDAHQQRLLKVDDAVDLLSELGLPMFLHDGTQEGRKRARARLYHFARKSAIPCLRVGGTLLFAPSALRDFTARAAVPITTSEAGHERHPAAVA